MPNATQSKDKSERKKVYFKHRPGTDGETIALDWAKGCLIMKNAARKWSANPEECFKYFLEGDLCFTPIGAFSINPIS